MTTEKAVKVWTNLVSLALLQVMALSASCLEQVGTLLGITWAWSVGDRAGLSRVRFGLVVVGGKSCVGDDECYSELDNLSRSDVAIARYNAPVLEVLLCKVMSKSKNIPGATLSLPIVNAVCW